MCDTYEKEYQRRDGSRVPVLITDAMIARRQRRDSGVRFWTSPSAKKAEQALLLAKEELEQTRRATNRGSVANPSQMLHERSEQNESAGLGVDHGRAA